MVTGKIRKMNFLTNDIGQKREEIDRRKMSKEIYFFTLKQDLYNIIKSVEQTISLKYVMNGMYDSPDINIYSSLEEYNDLGIKKSGEHQSESFLVLEEKCNLNVRQVKQIDGSIKYFVDQLQNENSIVLWPGGIYENQYLICGHVGTIKMSDVSKKILGLFQKSIKRQCPNRSGRFWYSNEVRNMNNQFRLITINVNQPKEYDLKI